MAARAWFVALGLDFPDVPWHEGSLAVAVR